MSQATLSNRIANSGVLSVPASHRDDPQPSKEAEERHTRSGHRHTNAETVLYALCAFCEPKTAAELHCVVDQHIKKVEEIRRRLYDLHKAGLVNRKDSRRCHVAKTSATTWAPTPEGLELVARMGS